MSEPYEVNPSNQLLRQLPNERSLRNIQEFTKAVVEAVSWILRAAPLGACSIP